MSNQVNLVGSIESDFIYSHSLYGETFYVLTLSVKRDSGKVDLIPLLVSDRLIDASEPLIGQSVYVSGEFRSHNQHDADKNRVKLYVFVNSIEFVASDTDHVNDTLLEGCICKIPTYRPTPLGKVISDVMLAVNRGYGKSSYIPCILWGRNAYFMRSLNVGDNIRVAGRIQSREYTKDGEVKTAYELSVNLVEVC